MGQIRSLQRSNSKNNPKKVIHQRISPRLLSVECVVAPLQSPFVGGHTSRRRGPVSSRSDRTGPCRASSTHEFFALVQVQQTTLKSPRRAFPYHNDARAQKFWTTVFHIYTSLHALRSTFTSNQ